MADTGLTELAAVVVAFSSGLICHGIDDDIAFGIEGDIAPLDATT